MSESQRKAVQDAVASLERTLGIEGRYEAGLIASAARIRQADAEIVVLRGALAESQARAEKAEAEVARLRAALNVAHDGFSAIKDSGSLCEMMARDNLYRVCAALEPTR